MPEEPLGRGPMPGPNVPEKKEEKKKFTIGDTLKLVIHIAILGGVFFLIFTLSFLGKYILKSIEYLGIIAIAIIGIVCGGFIWFTWSCYGEKKLHIVMLYDLLLAILISSPFIVYGTPIGDYLVEHSGIFGIWGKKTLCYVGNLNPATLFGSVSAGTNPFAVCEVIGSPEAEQPEGSQSMKFSGGAEGISYEELIPVAGKEFNLPITITNLMKTEELKDVYIEVEGASKISSCTINKKCTVEPENPITVIVTFDKIPCQDNFITTAYASYSQKVQGFGKTMLVGERKYLKSAEEAFRPVLKSTQGPVKLTVRTTQRFIVGEITEEMPLPAEITTQLIVIVRNVGSGTAEFDKININIDHDFTLGGGDCTMENKKVVIKKSTLLYPEKASVFLCDITFKMPREYGEVNLIGNIDYKYTEKKKFTIPIERAGCTETTTTTEGGPFGPGECSSTNCRACSYDNCASGCYKCTVPGTANKGCFVSSAECMYTYMKDCSCNEVR
jgi:hypothetical protein